MPVTETTGETLHFARIPAAVSGAARSGIWGLEVVASYIPYRTNASLLTESRAHQYFGPGPAGSFIGR